MYGPLSAEEISLLFFICRDLFPRFFPGGCLFPVSSPYRSAKRHSFREIAVLCRYPSGDSDDIFQQRSVSADDFFDPAAARRNADSPHRLSVSVQNRSGDGTDAISSSSTTMEYPSSLTIFSDCIISGTPVFVSLVYRFRSLFFRMRCISSSGRKGQNGTPHGGTVHRMTVSHRNQQFHIFPHSSH